MSTLTSQYGLGEGDSVFANVIATNVKGDSVTSLGGNNALVITSPDVPVSLAEDVLERTSSTLGLTW